MIIHTPACIVRQPGPFPKNRKCADPRCSTLLHTRHEGRLCYLHEARADAKARSEEYDPR